jgi:hypothetical protein
VRDPIRDLEVTNRDGLRIGRRHIRMCSSACGR